jgi:hypothetical protein
MNQPVFNLPSCRCCCCCCCPQVLVFCEICHNVRKSFNLQQLAQVVSFMACTIAERSQYYQNQSTCVRLSLNLVECLYQVGAWILTQLSHWGFSKARIETSVCVGGGGGKGEV